MTTEIDTTRVGDDGQVIHPLLANTAKDGSGDWYVPKVDSDGNLRTDSVLATVTPSGPNVTTTSGEALAANTARKYAAFINDSNVTIYLALGTTAVVNQGIRLSAHGGSYEITSMNLFTGVVNAIHGGTGNKVLCLTEGV
jgi:hypothetical protein